MNDKNTYYIATYNSYEIIWIWKMIDHLNYEVEPEFILIAKIYNINNLKSIVTYLNYKTKKDLCIVHTSIITKNTHQYLEKYKCNIEAYKEFYIFPYEYMHYYTEFENPKTIKYIKIYKKNKLLNALNVENFLYFLAEKPIDLQSIG